MFPETERSGFPEELTGMRDRRSLSFKTSGTLPNRWLRWCAWSIFFLLLFDTKPAQGADPRLQWRTFSTENFVITYPVGYENWAGRTARLAEKAHDLLVPFLGWKPSGPTHIVITDYTDMANGWAMAYFRRTITVFAVSPDDVSELSDFDDWLWGLILHEYTHILHMDVQAGLPKLVNRIFGQVWVPNSLQPTWVLEGLAIYTETRFTTAGRNRSSYYDMILRMSALNGRLQRLDEISSRPVPYPHGAIPYLYGSRFLWYLANREGPDNLRFMSADYGSRLIPFGLQQSFRSSFGRGLDELYRGFVRHQERLAREDLARVEARGRREGRPLVAMAENTFYPVFHPTDPNRLVYIGHDGHRPNALRHLVLDGQGRVRSDDSWEQPVLEAGPPTWMGDRVLYHQVDYAERVHTRVDLFRSGPKGAVRMTEGARLAFPVLQQKTGVAVRLTRGGHELVRINDRGRVLGVLVPAHPRRRIYGPNLSPDGRTVAFSMMFEGRRDIWTIPTVGGTPARVTDDSSMDVNPAWTPDGRFLLFSSDRDGIYNLYAYEPETGRFYQVTNVISGAFAPTVSADGRRLVYAGYTEKGFNLFIMPFEPERFLPAPEAFPLRPAAAEQERPQPVVFPDRSYLPFLHLAPLVWFMDYSFSMADHFSMAMMGFDPVELHQWSASANWNPSNHDYDGQLVYRYGGWWWPVDLALNFGRVERSDARINREWVDYHYGYTRLEAAISVPLWQRIKRYASTYWYFSWQEGIAPDDWAPTRPDYPLPSIPVSFSRLAARAGFWYQRVESSRFALEWESGEYFSVSLEPAWRSDTDNIRWIARADAMVRRKLPVGRHTVVTGRLRLGGSHAATAPVFAVGGPQMENRLVFRPWMTPQNLVPGFPDTLDVGLNYWVGSFSVTFPITWIGAGVSTLPFFARRLSAKLYGAVGEAFDDTTDWMDPLVGAGAELRLHLVAGYMGDMDLVFGVRKGIWPEEEWQPYFQFSSPLPEGAF